MSNRSYEKYAPAMRLSRQWCEKAQEASRVSMQKGGLPVCGFFRSITTRSLRPDHYNRLT